MNKIFFAGTLLFLLGCKNKDANNDPDVPTTPVISHSVIHTFPHDTSSFTEGLLIYKGKMYESTGLEGKSKIIETDIRTGKAIRSVDLDNKYFGEGIVILNDTIYQLTYKSQVGFMYSLDNFKKIGEFRYETKEGWGMTTDGKYLIASDGSSNLFFYEPGTFRLIRTQSVTEFGTPVGSLNELEYIDGFIYANQWQSPYILKIDINSGAITGKFDMSAMAESIRQKNPMADVMNGIAYDSATKKVYITGKNWPELYEVQFSK